MHHPTFHFHPTHGSLHAAFVMPTLFVSGVHHG